MGRRKDRGSPQAGMGSGGRWGGGQRGRQHPPAKDPGASASHAAGPTALDGPPGAWPARTHAPASVDAGATRLRKATERQDTAGGPRCERR